MEVSLQIFAIPFFRALGLITVLPFGSELLGYIKRICFALGLALLALPTHQVVEQWNWFVVIFEFILGAFLAFPLALLISAVKIWGSLFDSGRGQTMGILYDPISGVGDVYTAILLQYFIWALLLWRGVLDLLIDLFFRSFELFPVASFSVTQLGELGRDLLNIVSFFVTNAFEAFLPVAALFLLIDLAFGLISKALPQTMLYSEAFQLKTYLALLLMISLQDLFPLEGLRDYAALNGLGLVH